MQDEIARLQEELTKIEQLMASSEGLRQQLPDGQVDRMLESWHKQAERIGA